MMLAVMMPMMAVVICLSSKEAALEEALPAMQTMTRQPMNQHAFFPSLPPHLGRSRLMRLMRLMRCS
jgi:hypothetical protein